MQALPSTWPDLADGAQFRRFLRSQTMTRRPTPWNQCNSFSEFGVLGLSLLVDGNVGIGALPQIQEGLVRLLCGGFIAHHLLRAAELEPSQGSSHMSYGKTGIVDQLLELSRSRSPIAEPQICDSADVGGVHRVERS